MRDLHTPHYERAELFALDPVSLTALALGIGGSLATKALSGGGGADPTPTAVPATPAPAQSPQGSASTNKPSAAPSFLSAAAAPSQGNTTGAKTLLGA